MRQMFETSMNVVSDPMINRSSLNQAPTASRVRFLVLGFVVFLTCASGFKVLSAADKVVYELQVKPLLEAKCIGCHGPETQESHLRVDRKWSLLKGGDSGEPGIVESNSSESHLIQLVSGKDSSGKAMPPEPDDRLSAEEVSLLIRWIDEGAEWPGEFGQRENPDQKITHWSFQTSTARCRNGCCWGVGNNWKWCGCVDSRVPQNASTFSKPYRTEASASPSVVS